MWINSYISNRYSKANKEILKESVPESDLEYSKELHKLNNDYLLASDEIEIKREMLPERQFKVGDLWNIPIGNVKKLNFFDKKSMWFILKTCSFTKDWDQS